MTVWPPKASYEHRGGGEGQKQDNLSIVSIYNTLHSTKYVTPSQSGVHACHHTHE
ncbi:hypothetical protein I79_009851 [Cricetulus griseus]|uniref:Uncharacterized protein n=1 Tax=Cricetulus griseus TaxID=10029 RepID=G3HGV9_CRIGR|nr:hypothetical protein I79_009851 [Cricetulus griseus]